MKRRKFIKSSLIPSLGIGLSGLACTEKPTIHNTETVREPSSDIPVIYEADICVLGGSCTGVFAAVRAARLGAKVAIVEKNNHFGGVATITCTWHSFMDTEFRKQIIAGLSLEVIERLKKRNAVEIIEESPSKGFEFRPGEIKIILDELITEEKVKPYLHTIFSSAIVEGENISAVIVENKSGRGAIKARYFVDATGDGDLCARLNLPTYTYPMMLPPTTCAFIDKWEKLKGINLGELFQKHGHEFNYNPQFIWGSIMPKTEIYMLAGTRVNEVDCSIADDLTSAEIEGRRQVKAITEIIRKYYPDREVYLHDFPSSIGIRDTRHIECQYKITSSDILDGKHFEDAIANGSYRVDIHHQDKPGITLRYLDGTETYSVPGKQMEYRRWREETSTNPTFYQVPLRSLIPGKYRNLMLAGRMLDAEMDAFGAVRVQVNTNQMGEAAGVATWIALNDEKSITEIDPEKVRNLLSSGGSIMI